MSRYLTQHTCGRRGTLQKPLPGRFPLGSWGHEQQAEHDGQGILRVVSRIALLFLSVCHALLQLVQIGSSGYVCVAVCRKSMEAPKHFEVSN